MKRLKVKKHEERADLTGEHPLGDIGQLVLLILFLGLWVADTFFLKFGEKQYFSVPVLVHIIIGSFILILGFYYARSSIKMIFGTKQEKPQVVSNKIYEKVRHPMYLGSILFYLGITFIMYSLPLFIMFIVIFLFYNFIASHEEKLLINRFGFDYEQYMNKTRRWIPKF